MEFFWCTIRVSERFETNADRHDSRRAVRYVYSPIGPYRRQILRVMSIQRDVNATGSTMYRILFDLKK